MYQKARLMDFEWMNGFTVVNVTLRDRLFTRFTDVFPRLKHSVSDYMRPVAYISVSCTVSFSFPSDVHSCSFRAETGSGQVACTEALLHKEPKRNLLSYQK